MNDNNIFENAFNNIDDELIAEAKSPAIRIAARRKKIVISTIAACIAAVLVAIPSVKVISDLNDNNFTYSEDIETEYIEYISQGVSSDTQGVSSDKPSNSKPTSIVQGQDKPSKTDPPPSSIGMSSSNTSDGSLDNITIKPKDLYFTNIGVNGPTTTYEEVYSPNIEYLYLNPIPGEKYVTIYETYYQKEFDKNEVKVLADKYFPKMAETLYMSLPSYEIKERFGSLHDGLEIETSLPLDFTQLENRNIIGYNSFGSINLKGKPVTVNQTQSDQEIIESLSDIKQILFDTFDVSFDSARVHRKYPDDSEYGVSSLNIYFYNSNAHPLNNYHSIGVPNSDCIVIHFDNIKNFKDDIVSATDLYNVFSINYWSYRTDNHSPLKTVAQKELLPLQKAEEYLYKGYVLAMGGCSFCQAEQTPVDFTDYDYVSFEYRGGNAIGDLTLPYYAFYKNIGTAQNGNMAFAKTYVPAVEVEGYEEYFKNNHNNHNNTDNGNIGVDDIIDNPKPPA